jgi:hypothetical protein
MKVIVTQKVFLVESVVIMDQETVKLKMKNLTDDDTDDDTDDNLPSAGGWSKYNSQPDFVKFNFTSQSGFKPPNPAPSEVRDFFMLFFTPELIREFTKNTNEYAKEQIKKTPLRERLNRKPHFIYSNEKSNSKDCAVCSNRRIKGGRRETVFYCNTCTRKPGLLPGECFKKYHSLKKYK